MDIDRARTFIEIIHTGSFQGAAERLHVTQTTVSARIRLLEEDLGRRLFVRNRNGAQLTPAGRQFERYAQSFVQVWERARQHVAIAPGKTSVIALGGELSLWNPILLEWLVWMKDKNPEIAMRAYVGMPDQLLEQLRTGILDIAILYAPHLLPGFKVEMIEEEQLVLVRTTKGAGNYVRIDWGPLFAPQLDAASSSFDDSGLIVGLGPLGLGYILRVGGVGYFRRAIANPFIESGELQIVENAPQFTYPIYAIYLEESEARAEIRSALAVVKSVVGRHGLTPNEPNFF